MTTLQKRIHEAYIATEPYSLERTKALRGIRWVLSCAEGYAALSDDMECILVDDPAKAQVFDGRDNEVMKQAFYRGQLGRNLVPALL